MSIIFFFLLPTSNFQLPTTGYQLPTTNYRLPTTNYRLLTTDFSPLIPKREFYNSYQKLYNRILNIKLDLCKVEMISQLKIYYYEKGKENVADYTIYIIDFTDYRFYEP